MPTVSIIIPCYNGARWLNRCLESIENQTFSDYEVIIVDDGSTDNSCALAGNLASKDHRIRLINKENGGVSSARNQGLENATGEWITFVDIDDTLPSDALATMVSLAKQDIDIVFAGYIKDDHNRRSSTPALQSMEMTPEALAVQLFKPTDFPYLGYPWAKLFRKSTIEKHAIRFNEQISYNEDRLFTFQFLAHAKKGFYTTTAVYNYILNGSNAMSAIEGPSYWKFETDLDAFIEMNRIASSYSRHLKNLILECTVKSYLWNKRLNRQYGNNDYTTRVRLKQKMQSVVPASFYMRMTLKGYKNIIASKIYKLIK